MNRAYLEPASSRSTEPHDHRWLAVLLGQGFTPRRTDPLADIVPIEDVTRSIANYREAIKSFVDSQPVYHQVFSSLGQHA